MATTGNSESVVAAAVTPSELEMAIIRTSTAAAPPPPPLPTKKETDTDSFLVKFDESYDAQNPLDWPTGRKWLVTDVLSATGFNRIMVSTIMAPALPSIAKELHMSDTEAAMSLSIYLLATAFGPLAIGPLSELYGRQVVLHASGIWFFVWNVVCGFASTKETLIASRFLAGFGASAIYSLAGGVLGDIWRPEHRGRSLGMYLLIPLLGAAVGPIIGGFMSERTTWRWMFWSTSIFQGVMVVVSFFCFFETYAPVVLQRRAAKIRKETGNDRYHTVSEKLNEGKSSVAILKQALTRPLRLLAFHPLIQVSSLLAKQSDRFSTFETVD
ncbi:fungal specific transcription factor domain-containing protein [Purpureocillium lavendulum]|uniref:Fungal specific transcription factor domain-containing protein n=1 Tax=Purpureocillium lavendulum TaxID=1247861 RepID=A0AB34FWJ3_9HYPO|nr:fungal specific transcription factor domain-containing protein [Purpureocillium lavendulum]